MKLDSLHHASVFCGACGQNHEQYSHFSKRKAQEYADKKVKRCYERLATVLCLALTILFGYVAWNIGETNEALQLQKQTTGTVAQ